MLDISAEIVKWLFIETSQYPVLKNSKILAA